MLLIYTAIRNIAPGHVADEEYTIAIGARQLVPDHAFEGTSASALDGTIETDLGRIESTWEITTDLIEAGTDWEVFQEFLQSTAGGELFIFDPSSSNPGAEVSPTLAMREPRARIQRPENQPRHFTVTFTIRQVPEVAREPLPVLTLTGYIQSLGPKHWWKMDEASGSLADSGDPGGLTMLAHNGAQTYGQAGPTADSKGIDFTPAGHFRKASSPLTFAAGTILAIYDTDDLSSNTMIFAALQAASDETGMIYFGFGDATGGFVKQLTVGRRYTPGTNYSSWRYGANISEPTPGTPEWHLLIATCDGTAAPILYDDNVPAASPVELAGGSWSGADGDWFQDMGNDAVVLGNGRYGSTTRNLSGVLSHVAIFDRVLTAGERALLQSLMPEV